MDNLVVIGLLVSWFALIVIPIARILRRAGFNQWLALIALLPLVNLIGLWTFAFVEWRTDTAPTLVRETSGRPRTTRLSKRR
jgi:hypothetical protein